MNWTQEKYLMLLSSRLRNFSRKSPNLFNFSCPPPSTEGYFCGDSTKNLRKARGYVFSGKNGGAQYHCHNCGTTLGFDKFLKTLDESLYSEYKLESFKDKGTKKRDKFEELSEKLLKINPNDELRVLPKLSSLSEDHPAISYVAGRKIPKSFYDDLYYAAEFKKFVCSLIPGKFSDESLTKDENRIIIPFRDRNGDVTGFQGRSLNPEAAVRYVSIVTDETKPHVYGLDRLDSNRTTYVFEGPIDSMFVQNSIAVAGGELASKIKEASLSKNRIVMVHDNEPRSITSRKKIDRSIQNGYKVCIWPDDVREKDVNEMFLAGLSSERIKKIIDENTYSGIGASLRLSQWSKMKFSKNQRRAMS